MGKPLWIGVALGGTMAGFPINVKQNVSNDLIEGID